jgi:hypothetical protein
MTYQNIDLNIKFFYEVRNESDILIETPCFSRSFGFSKTGKIEADNSARCREFPHESVKTVQIVSPAMQKEQDLAISDTLVLILRCQIVYDYFHKR